LVSKMVRLSICIPVYNFGGFIKQTLDSIASQRLSMTDDVEVLVVDGASTDDTAAIVSGCAAEWPQLRYVQLPKKGGIDADLAESVRLARGEYCWLFSGDDVMRSGALERVMQCLEQSHDVYISKHGNCDVDMKPLGEHPVFRSDVVRIAELSDPLQRRRYLSEAMTSEAVFSFMSGLIVRRSMWFSVPEPQEFMSSCWGHVARLLTVAQTQLRVCYVGEVWLDKRGENDSFLDRGFVNRLRIAVDGYQGIADRYFGHTSPEAAQIRRLVRNDLGIRVWLNVKHLTSQSPQTENRLELDRLMERCYSDSTLGCWVARMTYKFMPIELYDLLRASRRQVLNALKFRHRSAESTHK
jgi:abequosyltransferase